MFNLIEQDMLHSLAEFYCQIWCADVLGPFKYNEPIYPRRSDFESHQLLFLN